MIVERMPATIELALAAMVVTLLIALPLGIIAAVRRGTLVDHSAMTFALAGISVPNFWLGPLLAIVFAVELGWLPVSGRGGLASLVLPAFSLGLALAAILARMTRASLLEELHQLYVQGGARAWRLAIAIDRAARAGKQPGAGRHHRRIAVRRGTHWRGHHRDDLCLAGYRPVADPVHRLSRLPDGAGLHSLDCRDLRRA